MPRRKSVGPLHVGDIVIYEDQRMRVAGFPTARMVILVACVLTLGRPSHVKTSVTDKKIKIVTQVKSALEEEETKE